MPIAENRVDQEWISGIFIENLDIHVGDVEVEPNIIIKDWDADDYSTFDLGQLDDYWMMDFGPIITPARVESTISIWEEWENSYRVLLRVFEALLLYAPGKIQVIGRYIVPRDWMKREKEDWVSKSIGESLTHMRPFVGAKMTLDEDDRKKFPTFWARWKTVPYTTVSEAIEAYRRVAVPGIESRISALTQCLESLLSEGPGDLRYKVAMRGAFLATDVPVERRGWFKWLQKCYDIRSDVVHAKSRDSLTRDINRLTKLIKEDFQTIDEFVDKLDEMTRQLIPVIGFEGQDRSSFLSSLDEDIVGSGYRQNE